MHVPDVLLLDSSSWLLTYSTTGKERECMKAKSGVIVLTYRYAAQIINATGLWKLADGWEAA
jgi:hypothetical protein